MSVDLATKSLLHDKLRFLITVSGVAFAGDSHIAAKFER